MWIQQESQYSVITKEQDPLDNWWSQVWPRLFIAVHKAHHFEPSAKYLQKNDHYRKIIKLVVPYVPLYL